MSDFPTIAALATAPAPAGLAVIRVSGSMCKKVLQSIFQGKRSPVDEPRKLIYGKITDPKSSEIIDHALAVYMPGPHSYTGEDIAEFHMHGSLILVQRLLRSLYAFGVSPAEPGEFTKRAFLNGKIDLVQAEAIGDLISASSDEALKIATEQIRGRFSSALHEIGEPLRDSLAQIEANIDFPEEGIEPEALTQIAARLNVCQDRLGDFMASYSYGQVVKEGYRVLLAGRPNAGKSSLLNLLLGAERAIVTEIAGTTRDLIEEQATLSGYRFVFCDTAGIIETQDKVEQIGIKRAIERLNWSDLTLLVVDASENKTAKDYSWREIFDQIRSKSKRLWIVFNKIDLAPDSIARFADSISGADRAFYLSCKSREGFKYLTEALIEEVSERTPLSADSSTIITSERHRSCLERASVAIGRAVSGIETNLPLEIISAELRIALSALEEIVGKTWTEDILGRIFSKFCIGK
jgi:tRNA modification GTPase